MLELLRKKKNGNTELVIPGGLLDYDSKANTFGSEYSLSGLYSRLKRFNLLNNPIVPNAADIVDWVIYDTYTVAAATQMASPFTFFNVPDGTNGKTVNDTNLEQVQRLPDPQWFNTVSLGIEFGPSTLPIDINSMVNNYVLSFIVGGTKPYAQGRFTLFPSGGGLVNSVSTTNGFPSWTNQFDLRLPGGIDLGSQINPDTQDLEKVYSDGLIGVTILQGQNFKVVCFAPGGAPSTATGGNGLKVICNLYGILSRGVQ